jgi:hypothetical protein
MRVECVESMGDRGMAGRREFQNGNFWAGDEPKRDGGWWMVSANL